MREPGAALEGTWSCGVIPVKIYPDGVASVSGIKAGWSGVGHDSLRLEYSEQGASIVADLTLSGKNEDGERTAVLGLPYWQLECTEKARTR